MNFQCLSGGFSRVSSAWGNGLCAVTTVAIASGLYAQPALAHHPLGGRLPTNAFEGLMSGLAHPILGLDIFCLF
ncbi:MAG: hypothetical protein HC824_19395, partial [Synechococcales cyanobacterium RM1_1_8]|nr:hypothetical protein [Synechococcales cyanobacterium RM1_1_8]